MVVVLLIALSCIAVFAACEDIGDIVEHSLVVSIEDFSSAEKAGIKIGDVITSVDGKKITNMDELNEIKNSHNIGDVIKLTIFRDGNEREIELTLQEQ